LWQIWQLFLDQPFALQDLSKNEAAKKSASKFFQDVFSDPQLQKKAGKSFLENNMQTNKESLTFF